MSITMFSTASLLNLAQLRASDTSQAGQLVLAPSYGWIVAGIAIPVSYTHLTLPTN